MTYQWSTVEHDEVSVDKHDDTSLCYECGAFCEDGEYVPEDDEEFCFDCYDEMFGA